METASNSIDGVFALIIISTFLAGHACGIYSERADSARYGRLRARRSHPAGRDRYKPVRHSRSHYNRA